MKVLLFIYIVATLIISGSLLFQTAIWSGIALLIGSFLGFAGGSGIRTSLRLGNGKSGVILGIALLFAGMFLVFASDVIVRVFGVGLAGDNWVFLGFCLGFLSTSYKDSVLGNVTADQSRDEVEKWQQAINDFGALMEQNPLAVLPESRLPLPKKEMKQAFKAAWLQIDEPYMREMIEAGYVQLAHFRADVTHPIDLDLRPKSDLSREQLLTHVVEREGDLKLWGPVNEEAASLLAEFASFKSHASGLA